MKKMSLYTILIIQIMFGIMHFAPETVFAQKEKAKAKKESSVSKKALKKSQRKQVKTRKTQPKKATPSSVKIAPAKVAAPVAAVEKTSDGLPTKDAKAQAKSTSLTVTTNTKVGTIYLDGILAGDVGTPIETDAGVVEIEVKAAGFISQKAKVRIRENEANQIALVLQKPQPKPTPAPPPPKKSPAVVANTGTPKAPRSVANQNKNEGLDLDKLPAPNLQDELFAGEDQFAPQPQFNQPQSSGVIPYSPYGAVPQQFPQQPYPYPYPMYPSQPYGYYPQPQFAQPAFPQYPVSPYQQTPQQPGALVPNDPFAIPPPSGSLNSRDVFTESSPSAGAGGYSNPQEQAPVPISEAPTDIPKKGGRKKSGRSGSFTPTTNSPAIARNKPAVVRRSSVGKNNIFVCLLPLGIGQFYQGKILLGGAVALAQVGSIYYALDSKSKAEAQAVKAKTVNDDPNFTDVEKTAFLESSNVYIDEQNKAKDMGFMLFGAAWAVGAAEAIVNPPKVRRTRSSYSLLLPEKNSELAKADEIQNIYSEAVSATPQANISLELGLIAMEETKEDSMAPVWGANLNIWW